MTKLTQEQKDLKNQKARDKRAAENAAKPQIPQQIIIGNTALPSHIKN